MRLTATQVEKLTLPKGKTRHVYPDDAIRGFGVRVSRTARSYIFHSRSGTTKLGDVGVLAFHEAQTMALKCRQALTDGNDPAREVREQRRQAKMRSTVSELIDHYVDRNVNANKATKNKLSYKQMRRFRDRFGSWQVDELQSSDVHDFLVGLASVPGSAREVLANVRRVYNYGKVTGVVGADVANPADNVGAFLPYRLSPRKSYAFCFEDQQLTAFYGAIEESYRDGSISPIALACIELTLHLGGRPGEVQSLETRMIDLAARQITKWEHKSAKRTGVARILRLSEPAIEVLDRATWARQQEGRYGVPADNGFVFPTRGINGKRPFLSDLNVPLGEVCERAGLPRLTPHSLRSAYINLSIDNGVLLKYVSENVGHANEDVTLKHYVRNRLSRLTEAADASGAALRRFVPDSLAKLTPQPVRQGVASHLRVV